MIKSPQKTALNAFDFNYITAITRQQIANLIKTGVLQLGLFDTKCVEISDQDKRYILRCNPIRKDEIRQSRLSKMKRLEEIASESTLYLSEHPKAKVATQARKITQKINDYGCARFCELGTVARVFSIQIDLDSLKEEERLDGCYVLETDVLSSDLSTSDVHARYKDLAKVETAFRTMKTGLLEIRPIFVRKESRTRGHVFVTMLAYLLFQDAWCVLKEKTNFSKDHCLSLIQSLQTVTVSVNGLSIKQIPSPNPDLKRILDALNLKLPLAFNS